MVEHKLRTATSRALYNEAREVLVDGVASALHKSPDEEYPIYIERGEGSKLFDVDGNEYIDYLAAYGPMILGYNPPAVNRAVIDQINKGTQFAAPYKQLNEVSKLLQNAIPCADMVSYQMSGTEANMLAFRLARSYTGKRKIVKFEGHYHGWSDEELVSFSSDSLKQMGPRNRPWKTVGSRGQLEDSMKNIIVIPWNDLRIVEDVVKRNGHDIAAVITEPVMCNCEPVMPQKGYLEGLRAITRKEGILLIFDEIITGFRLALGGAQEYFGVVPDLSTFGKALAAGYPLAVVAGKREIMESGVHPVGTFNANPICIEACKATLGELSKPDFYKKLERITEQIVDGVRKLGESNGITLYCDHIGSIWQIEFGISSPLIDYRDSFRVDRAMYQRFRQELLARGVRVHPTRGRQYVTSAHTAKDIDRTLEVINDAFVELRQ